jgi:hypothetical protein
MVSQVVYKEVVHVPDAIVALVSCFRQDVTHHPSANLCDNDAACCE